MTYINFITGLIIAAVLSVPGAMQHEATQVGEELVVEKAILQEEWFLLVSGDPTDFDDATTPSNYEMIEGDGLPCQGEDILCAIRAIPDSPGSDPLPIISGGVHQALEEYLVDNLPANQNYIAEKDE